MRELRNNIEVENQLVQLTAANYPNEVRENLETLTIELRDKDVIEVAKLARKIFKKFAGSDYFDKEGIQGTLDFFDTEKRSAKELIECFRSKSMFFIAEDNNKIIGMIRGTSKNISSLYVDEKEHKKGIATKLIQRYEKEAIKQGSDLITLESTIYAMPFYKKMGFKKTTDIVNPNGMKSYMMEITLKNGNL